MAKKTVALLQKGEGRTYSKSDKNGKIAENRGLYFPRGNGSE